jgi:FkbM family methyltransferase
VRDRDAEMAEAALRELLAVLPVDPSRHVPDGPDAMWWAKQARSAIAVLFSSETATPGAFGPFGALSFPFVRMGAVTSLELFGLDELILFAFYHANRGRYRRAVDFGANIGLHSTIMARCGFEVRSFEPDPHHLSLFARNTALNGVTPELHAAAVSIEAGEMSFVRVLGNTTGSHLAGAKADPYGELERFTVNVEAALPHLAWADLAKIDIEGHEAVLISALDPAVWLTTDAVLEVGTPDNAAAIWRHLAHTGVSMFAQKIGWSRVLRLEDMPTGYREGSLFLTGKDAMPWS